MARRTQLATQYATAPSVRTIPTGNEFDHGAGAGSASVDVPDSTATDIPLPSAAQLNGSPTFDFVARWVQLTADTATLNFGFGTGGANDIVPYGPDSEIVMGANVQRSVRIAGLRLADADGTLQALTAYQTSGAQITVEYAFEVPTLDWE